MPLEEMSTVDLLSDRRRDVDTEPYVTLFDIDDNHRLSFVYKPTQGRYYMLVHDHKGSHEILCADDFAAKLILAKAGVACR